MPFRPALVLRNAAAAPRRAAFVVANMVVGMMLVVLIDGYATSMFRGMRDGLIASGLGHAQILPAALEAEGRLQSANIRIPAADAEAARAAVEALPGVVLTAFRWEGAAMATNGDASQVGTLVGVDPDAEAVLSAGLRTVSGRELFADDGGAMLLGEGLAQALGFRPGDMATLLGNTASGMLNAIDLDLAGTVTTGSRDADARLIHVTQETARAFLATDDPTRLVVLLADPDAADAFAAAANAALPPGLVARTWRELAPNYGEVVDLFGGIFLVIKLAIGAFVVLAIGNTIAICVVERTREIGVARALGDTRGEVVAGFALEGAALGALGAAIGVPLAVLAAWGLSNAGLTMPTPPGSSIDYPLRFIVTWPNAMTAAALGFGAAAVASIVPALGAARIDVTEALRHA